MTKEKPVGWRREPHRHAQAARGIRTGVLPQTGTIRAWPPTPTKPKKTGYQVAYRMQGWNFKLDVDASTEKEAGRAVKKHAHKTHGRVVTIVKIKQIPDDEWGRRYSLIDSEGNPISPYLRLKA